VVVIGAGPAGCFLAEMLAKRGVDVAVVEEDPQVGNPACCAGIVGMAGLRELRIKKGKWTKSCLSGAIFYSPSGQAAEFKTSPQAWVIDRAQFDRELALSAAEAGATFYLKTKCVGLSLGKKPKFRLRGAANDVECEIAVGADGPTSVVARALGSVHRKFIKCVQVETSLNLRPGLASIWLGRDVAPGFFAWGVNTGEFSRVGLGCTNGNPLVYLRRLLKRLGIAGKVSSFCTGLIPEFFVQSPGKGRVLLVGDAAGQVKPLTGGGVYLGLSCSKIAAESIVRAQDEGMLERVGEIYSTEVRKRVEREVKIGSIARELFQRLSDKDLESIVLLLKRDRIRKLIVENFDFDHHGALLKAVVKEAPVAMREIGLKKFLKYFTVALK